MTTKRIGERAFTLVELIIVILILGILAAIAIPQFVAVTSDARIATLQANLAVMRNGINLYHHQHNSVNPGAVKVDGTGTATVAGDNPAAFVSQMTQYTDADGTVSADIDRATYPYGPYVMSIPENPITGSAVVEVLDKAGPIVVGDVVATAGWLYNKQTGEIRSNSSAEIAY